MIKIPRASLILMLIAALFFLGPQFLNKDKNEVYMGTAWFINDTGYIVTAYHVVKGENHFWVRYKGRLYPAYIWAIDNYHDTVILKTFLTNTDYLPLALTFKDGDASISYGYIVPDVYGDTLHHTKGQVYHTLSLFGRYRNTAFTGPGDSGGPVIDIDGVIGIMNFGMPPFDKNKSSYHGFGTMSSYVAQLAKDHKILYYTSKLGFDYSLVNDTEVVEIYSLD